MKTGEIDLCSGKGVIASSNLSQGLPGSSRLQRDNDFKDSILELNKLPTFTCDNAQCLLGFYLGHLVDSQQQRIGKKMKLPRYTKSGRCESQLVYEKNI